jgi:hypothetical protein
VLPPLHSQHIMACRPWTREPSLNTAFVVSLAAGRLGAAAGHKRGTGPGSGWKAGCRRGRCACSECCGALQRQQLQAQPPAVSRVGRPPAGCAGGVAGFVPGVERTARRPCVNAAGWRAMLVASRMRAAALQGLLGSNNVVFINLAQIGRGLPAWLAPCWFLHGCRHQTPSVQIAACENISALKACTCHTGFTSRARSPTPAAPAAAGRALLALTGPPAHHLSPGCCCWRRQ